MGMEGYADEQRSNPQISSLTGEYSLNVSQELLRVPIIILL